MPKTNARLRPSSKKTDRPPSNPSPFSVRGGSQAEIHGRFLPQPPWTTLPTQITGSHQQIATNKSPGSFEAPALNARTRGSKSGYARTHLWDRPSSWRCSWLNRIRKLPETARRLQGQERTTTHPELFSRRRFGRCCLFYAGLEFVRGRRRRRRASEEAQRVVSPTHILFRSFRALVAVAHFGPGKATRRASCSPTSHMSCGVKEFRDPRTSDGVGKKWSSWVTHGTAGAPWCCTNCPVPPTPPCFRSVFPFLFCCLLFFFTTLWFPPFSRSLLCRQEYFCNRFE